MSILSDRLAAFPRIQLIGGTTPIQRLDGLSKQLGREIYIKRDDTAPLALAFGGNKLRKLEYLAAEALRAGADTLLTAGAIQSNHVRQTAAVAAQMGLACHALLTNPTGTADGDYLHGGNRLLLQLMGTETQLVDSPDGMDAQLLAQADRLRQAGRQPYIIPVGGSNALGTLGYVRAGLELHQQLQQQGIEPAAVVLACGSAGTQAGLSIALEYCNPRLPVVGVTVSRSAQQQRPRLIDLMTQTCALLRLPPPGGHNTLLWDDFRGPQYGECSDAAEQAINLLARTQGILLDPVYTGKAMAGLLSGIGTGRFEEKGPLLFLHTGGAPALFGYRSALKTKAVA